MDWDDPRLALAARLRSLRVDNKVTQRQLARALSGDRRRPLSDSLISSWESLASPTIPPLSRLDAYAALFAAAARSFASEPPAVVAEADLDADERSAMESLKGELRQLRNAAQQAANAPASSPDTARSAMRQADAMESGPWRFEDGNTITIVCPGWPPHMLTRIPYTNVEDPDYIELLTYSELDALFELYGHLRAANPANQVNLRVASKLARDDYTSHLVTLGGIDWNTLTSATLRQLDIPVRQIADWGTEGGQYFEAEENGSAVQHRPVLEESGDQPILREDVALFARAVNPFNEHRTVTICNGMYGRGSYGAVRALTDARFRDRNLGYLQSRFGDSDSYCILTRVPIVNGATLTPDWTIGRFNLYEWSGQTGA